MNRAQAIAALLALDRRGERRHTDWASHLFGPQRRFFESPDRVKVALTGRRAGKSTAVAARLLSRIDGRPGRNSLYLTLTRKNAKRILWPAALTLLRDLEIPHAVNLTDLEIRLGGGGTLLIGGVDTQDQVEKWRGDKYQDAAIDEMQSFPPERARSLIQDVLFPALADYQGDLLLTGTPGPVPAGYWYEISGPASRHTVHHWTGLDNPHLPNFAAELAAIREANGWTEESPTYLREYLGQWVLDFETLIYHYNPDRNACAALPVLTPAGAIVDPAAWRNVISVDLGEVHATAIVVAAAHPSLPQDYIVHVEKMEHMETGRLASRLRDLLVLFPGPIIADTQGVGKKHADEIRNRYGLPIEAADKADKASGIRIVKDRLFTGLIQCIEGASQPLISEWSAIIWNDQRNDHRRDQEDHAADAAIYAIKRLRNYTADHAVPPPKPGTREYWEAEERRILEARRRQVRRGNMRKGWNR